MTTAYVVLRHLSFPQKEIPSPLAVTPHAPPPSPWRPPGGWLPVSTDLPILDPPCKRNHTTCDFLCLASFTFSRSVILRQVSGFRSVFKAEYYCLVWIDHIVCLRVPAEGHLGCFYYGAVTNNASVSICVHLRCGHFSGAWTRRGTAGSCANSIVKFLRNHRTVHGSHTPLSIPTTMRRGSGFSVSSPALRVFPSLFFVIMANLVSVMWHLAWL